MDAHDDAHFPELSRCARRLGLDECALAEAMLCRLDNGEEYWPALHAVATEAVQRQGLYDEEVRRRIDSGRIFMEAEGLVPPMTPGRLVEALEFEHLDVIDALAAVGAMNAAPAAVPVLSEYFRLRTAWLDAVEAQGDEEGA